MFAEETHIGDWQVAALAIASDVLIHIRYATRLQVATDEAVAAKPESGSSNHARGW
jgi:hypothetical protein